MEGRYQVIIVGGGPVGVALALELGLRGISCGLVGRHSATQRIPKGQSLMNRTLEHFYFWGCVDELRAARVMPPDYPIGMVTAYGNLMSQFWYGGQGDGRPGGGIDRFYFQASERLPQYQTEEVLRKRLSNLPNVTTLYGWTAEKIEQDGNGVRVTFSETPGDTGDERRYQWAGFVDSDDASKELGLGAKQMWEADYLVGCDGARSGVREQLGIDLRGADFDQLMVLALFRSRELHNALKRFPEGTIYGVLHPDLKGYSQFFGRIDVGEGWFFHAPVPNDTTIDNYDFQALLNRAAGFEFEAEFDHVGFWDLKVSIADRYQVDRVFIAGDAAHSHPPYGGFGLNSGLEDVINLGWKLAAVLEGWGGNTLLESYSEERGPIIWETGQDFIANGIERDRDFLERYSPERDLQEFERAWEELGSEGGLRRSTYEPNYEGSPVVVGPLNGVSSAHGNHSLKARPGHHLAPQTLTSGRNVYEELGKGFTLLAFGAEDQAVKVFEQAAKFHGMPLKVVRDSCDGGRLAYESPLILVRPDQHVVWCSDTPPKDPASLIQKVVGIA